MKKTSNEIFKEWTNSIPVGEYQNKIRLLAQYCGVSIIVVNFWKNGRTKIKPVYQKLINEFACKKIFKV
ncbi:MAG: hypothetical protein LBS69_12200 [Prevotellaceae bacterium]|jgi:hypothetical protein|nr:hypothetical protein [Prevotellaceae bacterium]